ncbi:MAG TPA: NmrA family NAD(P)-binding protein [Pseudonocardia sp.]|jgi:uncharacterized protein YbjT (DUF2867 family)
MTPRTGTPQTGTPHLTLVLGAAGTTGRRVAERLAARGVPTRLGSRAGTPRFDWADDTTWPAVLTDVRAVYLVYYPDLVAPAALERVRAFAHLAVSAGARRLVLLSGRGEEQARAAERVVLESGAEWTVVRAAFFAQNFSEKGFEELVRAGTVALPAPPVGEPFVDADDIADVVVAALADEGHAGQLYEVTGPRLLTFEQAVAEIAEATGRPLDYRRVAAADFVAGLVAQGVPGEEASVFAEIFGTVLDGRNAHLADGVRRALGRPPTDFADYAATTATSGIWDPHPAEVGGPRA